jgi:hypothetical protein
MHIEPTVSLSDEFARYAKVARELAWRLSPGPERDDLNRRAQWAEDCANAVGSYSPNLAGGNSRRMIVRRC